MPLAAGLSTQNNHPLYQRIVDDIRKRIDDGEFAPGEQLLTIAQMCTMYDVSRITADRALQELKNLDLVETFRGRGAFVRGVPRIDLSEQKETRVSRIIVLWSGHPFVDKGFASRIWSGIVEGAERHGLPLNMEYIPASMTDVRKLPFTPSRDQGIIVLGAILTLLEFSLIENPDMKSILVDAACAGAPCVLTDNHDGMRQLLDHLTTLGHERIVLCQGFSNSFNSTNENERRESFLRIQEARGASPLVHDAGSYDSLFDMLDGAERPTAFLFPQDTPALYFMRLAHEKGLRIPEDFSVAGFDDWPAAAAPAGLTTVRVNREAIGRAAIENLLNPATGQKRLSHLQNLPTPSDASGQFA